ncbi:PREDICTED: gamma-crystallin B-like [Leptosomus discolor]|uniref:gamma-crystallin B-like n=1 Tax=Leptosomus discolor TaxID=188344 RepID=UPI00052282D0|nr:PREDICTED: gamma-crystallin B-like [Leptosomus discolor]
MGKVSGSPNHFSNEDESFWGHCYECSSDHLDLRSYVKQCNSIWVEKCSWMIYQNPSYLGHRHQYFLRKGEYPDYQHWMGLNDSIRFCCTITASQEHSRLQIYERMSEFMDNYPSLQDGFHYRNIQPCNTLDGSWVFYEQPQLRGLKPSENRRCTSWGAMTAKVGSFQPTADIS